MSNPRRFELRQILTVTTGVLLCEIGGLYDLLNYLTGDQLFTHQLPRAAILCKPWIIRQLPELAQITAEGVGRDNWTEFLTQQEELYGATHQLDTMPEELWLHIDPLQELQAMKGDDKVIVVEAPE